MMIFSSVFISKERCTKEIELYEIRNGTKYEIITTTEILDDTKVSGVRNAITRRQFTNRQEAIKSFNRRVKNTNTRGWIKRK